MRSLSGAEKKLYRAMVERAGYNCPYPGPLFLRPRTSRQDLSDSLRKRERQPVWWDMRLLDTADYVRIERW